MGIFQKLFTRTLEHSEPFPIIIVSGLPRSGTSMMMKILEAGGLAIVSDGLREADEDNPKGYYELEDVKALANGLEPAWLADAEGKVVKVITFLLQYLPATHRYKVIFMRREINEILASQAKMLERRHETSADSDEKVRDAYLEHLKRVKVWLSNQSNMDVLTIEHRALLEKPQEVIPSLIEFLGVTFTPEQISAMQLVPDKSLYRNRSA